MSKIVKFAYQCAVISTRCDVATMTVSLPDSMKDWIETRIRAGDYASSSDYVRDLVRRDREHKDKIAVLQKLIDEAEASGISPRTLDEIFAEARIEARRRGLAHG